MMSTCSHALLIALVSLAPADADQVLKNLQGKWTPDSTESEGSVLNPDPAIKIPYEREAYGIKGDKLTVFFAKGTTVEGKLIINASTTPKQFDVVFSDGTKYIGIFAVDEDVLVVSLQWGGSKKRPTHFTTHREDTEDRPIVYILRRQ
jgi:uncharacterized protein (TIGR03067 family)